MTDEQQEQHLPDVLDRASVMELENTERSIAEVRGRCKQVRQPPYSLTECDDCGLEVGEERMRVAIQNNLCIHCARIAERLARR